VSAFIEEQREHFGVEPICQTLGVSASAYHERATGRRSARAIEDERLLGLIGELHERNYLAYGSRRMWKALLRAGERVQRQRRWVVTDPPRRGRRAVRAAGLSRALV
jgi:hypothetical protein